MGETDVNPRRYDGAGRQATAAVRRRRVLAAAVSTVAGRGYAATTMAQLAGAAGVSVEYLYKTFGDKPRLMRAVLDFVLAGDDEPVPVDRRAEVQRMRDEPDARRVLALYARRCAEVNGRAAALLLAMAAGAAADPALADVVAVAEAQRLAAAGAVTADVAGKAVLRVAPEVARDAIWTLNSAEVWDLTVRRRGWSVDRYVDWLADRWIDELFGPR